MSELTLEVLRTAAASAAAFRSRRRLQLAGGEGDKVFPPTFAGAVYAVEKRRVAGRTEPVQCVLLDSVQSRANRMELALQEAVDAGKLKMGERALVLEAHHTSHVQGTQLTLEQIERRAGGRLLKVVARSRRAGRTSACPCPARSSPPRFRSTLERLQRLPSEAALQRRQRAAASAHDHRSRPAGAQADSC